MDVGSGGDEFDDLARPSGAGSPDSAIRLAAEISQALDEPPGRLAVVPDERDMAWLVRDGYRVSWFNLSAADRPSVERRARMVRSFADLIRRYDQLRPTIEGLQVGRRYRVQYKDTYLRRVFSSKSVLRSVSEFSPAEGVEGGEWVLRFEDKPAFYPPTTYEVHTSTLVDIRPVSD
jgi:hypothetical protein